MSEVNRRLPKQILLVLYQKGKLIKCHNGKFPDDALPCQVTLTDLVIDEASRSVLTLKELIKKTHATSVHGYQAFLEDKVPSIHECMNSINYADESVANCRTYQTIIVCG